MAKNPCIYTLKDGRILSYDEMRSYILEQEAKAPKTLAKEQQRLNDIAKKLGIKPLNFTDLYNANRRLFGLKAEEAFASAVVMDRMIGTMAERAGINKDAMYEKLEFQKSKETELLDKENALFQGTIDGKPVTLRNVNVDVVNGFYSPIEKNVKEYGKDKIKAKDWLNVVGKGGEAVFTGVRDFLEGKDPNAMVTKQEILDYMKDNRISVSEVVLKEGEGKTAKERFGRNIELEGEKENYKEVLVTLPQKKTEKPYEQWLKENFYGEDRKEARDLYAQQISEKSPNFKSTHFDEPNILVHLRMNTRTDADGNKVLFLEEVQSDWGQTGKKEGFKEEFVKAKEDGDNKWDVGGIKILYFEKGVDGKNYRTVNRSGEQEWFSSLEEANKTANETRLDRNRLGVPTAPFVMDTNAWTKLGLKVALKEAVAQGVDKIAWTTGEQQNDRYDLSKQVQSISYEKKSKEFSSKAQEKGQDLYSLYIETKESGYEEFDDLTISEVEGYIGKDIANKIQNNEGNKENLDTSKGNKKVNTLTGLDLKVGGKGMKGFYGSIEEGTKGIVGGVAEKLFGQKVGKTNIIKRANISSSDKIYEAYDNKGRVIKRGNSEAYIKSIAEANNGTYKLVEARQLSIQPSIDITPTLRAEVERGLALFQKQQGQKAQAAMVATDGNYIVHALTNPNVSSPLHEMSHIFEHYLDNDEKQTTLNWAGTETWTTETDEKFARGFEKYLAEGKAPSKDLQAIFDKFKQWLTDIYNGIKDSDIDIELNDDMRAIYAKMLGAEGKTKTEPKVEPKPQPKVEAKAKSQPKQVKRTVIGKRAYDSETNEDLREKLKEKGLYRDVTNQKVAMESAKEFVDENGIDATISVLNYDNTIPLNNQIALCGYAMVSANNQMIEAKTPEEYEIAQMKYAEIVHIMDKAGNKIGTGLNMFNPVYEMLAQENLSFNTSKLVNDYKKVFKAKFNDLYEGNIPKSIEKRFDEIEEKLKQNAEKLNELNKKIAEREAHIALLDIQSEAKKESKSTQERKIKAQEKLKEGLSEMFGALAGLSGGKLSAVESDESFIRGAKKAIEAIMEGTAITFEEAYNQVKQAIIDRGYNPQKLESLKENVAIEQQADDKTEGTLGLSKKRLKELAMEVDMSSSVTPEEQVQQYVDLVREEIQDKYPHITDKEIRDEISGYGKTIKESQDDASKRLSKMKNMLRSISQLEDIAQGIRPQKSGFQRNPTDQDVRSLFKKVREQLKTLPVDQETRDGLLKTAMDAYKRRLSNRIADLQKEIDTRTRTKKQKNILVDDDETTQLKDILKLKQEEYEQIFGDEIEQEKIEKRNKNRELFLQKKIDALDKALTNMKAIEKSQRPSSSAYSAQIAQKQKELDDLKELYNRVFKSEIDAQQQDSLIKAKENQLLKQIAKLEEEIASGIMAQKNRTASQPYSQTISDRQKRLKELKEIHEGLFADEIKQRKEQAKLEASKKNIRKRIAKLEKKIRDKDFAKKPKEKQAMDDEKKQLLAKKEELKEELDNLLYQHELENRTIAQKAFDNFIVKPMRLVQSLVTAIDFGLVGVQLTAAASRQAITEPQKLARNFKNALIAFSSPEFAEQQTKAIKADSEYETAKKAGLSLIGMGGEKSEFESDLLNVIFKKLVLSVGGSEKLSEKISPKAFERFNQVFGNGLRYDLFKNASVAAKGLGYSIEDDPKVFKDLAGTFNSFTGRASIGKLRELNKTLSLILFSPKNWASMIKTATPYGLIKFFKMSGNSALENRNILFNSPAKREAVKIFMSMVTVATTYTLLNALRYNDDDDENTWVNITDPDKADFMKVSEKLKDGSIVYTDLFGGRLNMIVTQVKLLQSLMGETYTTSQGKERDTTPFEILENHALNKTSPMASYIKDMARYDWDRDETGELVAYSKYSKEPIDLMTRTAETFYPMAATDIYQISQSEPTFLNGLDMMKVFIGISQVQSKLEQSRRQMKKDSGDIIKMPDIDKRINSKLNGL